MESFDILHDDLTVKATWDEYDSSVDMLEEAQYA